VTKQEIKNKLIEICKSEIQEKIKMNEKMMNEEQKTANQYKGAMESRYDTFKEEAQARKDAYAMQIDKLLKLNSILLSINSKTPEKAEPGAVIETDRMNYFIFFYLFDEPVTVGNQEFCIISLESPVGIALKNKKINGTFIFNGNEFRILNIY
jgi:hypothetical protein